MAILWDVGQTGQLPDGGQRLFSEQASEHTGGVSAVSAQVIIGDVARLMGELLIPLLGQGIVTKASSGHNWCSRNVLTVMWGDADWIL